MMWDETYLLSELPSEEETEEEVNFIWNILELTPGAIVLDLCCGEGRHAIRLAEMGCAVVGVDASRLLLNEAQNAHQPLTSKILFLEADMRALPLKSACDVAVNLFTSFGFFDDEGNLKVLAEIAAALKPGGKLLLDYWNPYTAVQLDGTRNWWWIREQLLALAEVKFDPMTGVLSDYRTILDLNQHTIKESVNRIRFYFPTELEDKLLTVGFRLNKLYGDFDGHPFDLDARRLIAVAERMR